MWNQRQYMRGRRVWMRMRVVFRPSWMMFVIWEVMRYPKRGVFMKIFWTSSRILDGGWVLVRRFTGRVAILTSWTEVRARGVRNYFVCIRWDKLSLGRMARRENEWVALRFILFGKLRGRIMAIETILTMGVLKSDWARYIYDQDVELVTNQI